MIRPTASFFITYLALPLQRWKFMVYNIMVYKYLYIHDTVSLYLKSCDKIEMLDIFCLQCRTISAPVATFCQPNFQVRLSGFTVIPLSWTGEPMQNMRIFNTRKIYQVHSPRKRRWGYHGKGDQHWLCIPWIKSILVGFMLVFGSVHESTNLKKRQ